MTLRTPRYGNKRRGLTLLEVVVSMLIFMISIAAIFQLVTLGSQRAMDVQQQSLASMRCQSQLNRVLVGAEALTTTSYTALPDDPDWQWRLEADEHSAAGLWNVRVWVKYESQDGRIIESHLSQLVLDPSIRGSTLDRPPETMSNSSATPTDSSATSPSTDASATSVSAAASGSKTTNSSASSGTKSTTTSASKTTTSASKTTTSTNKTTTPSTNKTTTQTTNKTATPGTNKTTTPSTNKTTTPTPNTNKTATPTPGTNKTATPTPSNPATPATSPGRGGGKGGG